MLNKKKIAVGITGGIAAYKSCELIRRLKQQGAVVRVVMTDAAKQFITPLTLQALSGYPVADNLFDLQAEAAMGHIELARWADLIVVAPASADFIAKLSYGFADNLLLTVCLAARAPIILAPAMNQVMWQQAATQDNIQRLQHRGVQIAGPAVGLQACGENGPGRMLEPEKLLEIIHYQFQQPIFAGKKIVITAGPTLEAIDPVRFLSNQSSGKMGYALAEAAKQLGAEVTLISGPTKLSKPFGINFIAVTSAQQMYDKVKSMIENCDIFIAAAAVADYRVANYSSHKIKKTQTRLQLELIRNPDILVEIAKMPNRPLLVGFAAETDHVIEHALKKLQAKNIDMIVANQVGEHQGFQVDQNEVTILTKDDQQIHLPLADKNQIAMQIMQCVSEVVLRESCS